MMRFFYPKSKWILLAVCMLANTVYLSAQTYCSPTADFSGAYIASFATTGAITNISQTTAAPGSLTATGYSDYSASATVEAATNTAVTFLGNTSETYEGVGIWVDWNQDQDFDDPGEDVFITGYTGSTSFGGSFTVPAAALPGATRLRVRVDNAFGALAACGATSYGEGQDYTFSVIAQTLCTGAPAPGATLASVSGLCVSGSSTLSLTNNYNASTGISYQWQSSPDGATWSDIPGATSPTHNTGTISATTQYQCRLICSAGPDTGYSDVKIITVTPLPTVTVSPAQASFCSSVTLTASGADTYTWSPASGLSATTGAIVTASPAATTTYTVTGTVGGCTNTATASATPIGSIVPIATATDVCTDTSANTVTVTPVIMSAGTPEYELTDLSGALIATWQSSNVFNITPMAAGLNQYLVFARNTDCPVALSDTGRVGFYAGFGGTLVVNNASCANGDGSLTVTEPLGPGMPGGTPTALYSNDFSSATLDVNKAALLGTAVIDGGQLVVMPTMSGERGGLLVKNPAGITTNPDSIRFMLNAPASGSLGLSWSFGDDVAFDDNTAESGTGTKLIISFQPNFIVGSPGIYLTYGQPGGTTPATTVTATMLAYSSYMGWSYGINAPVAVDITTDGKLSLKLGGITVFDQVQLPAAYINADRSNWEHLFAVKTDISDPSSIDNLAIYYDGPTYLYGSAPALSNTLPVSWQSSNVFDSLDGGDSLDIWMASPSNPSGCNQKVGTYGITAPVVTALFDQADPNCLGTADGYIALSVNTPGNYTATYTRNGGSPYTTPVIASESDGSTDYVRVDVTQGSFSNITLTSSGGCVSNSIAGPIVLTAPAATGIAGGTAASSPTAQPGAGTQYYTDDSCHLITSITSPNNLGEVTASVTVGSSALTSPNNGEPFLGRYYGIAPTLNATLPAQVTLYFSEADFLAYNAAASVGNATYPAILSDGSNLKITAFHGLPSSGTTGPNGTYDATNAEQLEPSAIVWNTTSNWWEVTLNSPGGFSGFFANTNTNIPLFMDLEITAVNTGTRNLVQWNTKTAHTGDHFNIERSRDSRSFSSIGTLAAKGAAPSSYVFTDEQPFNGPTYYRLQLVNADGSREYSKVVVAVMNNGGFSFSVYPNPVSNELTIKVSEVSGKGRITLTDITGRILLQREVLAAGSITFPMGSLANGMYLLQYQDDANSQSLKLNKE